VGILLFLALIMRPFDCAQGDILLLIVIARNEMTWQSFDEFTSLRL